MTTNRTQNKIRNNHEDSVGTVPQRLDAARSLHKHDVLVHTTQLTMSQFENAVAVAARRARDASVSDEKPHSNMIGEQQTAYENRRRARNSASEDDVRFHTEPDEMPEHLIKSPYHNLAPIATAATAATAEDHGHGHHQQTERRDMEGNLRVALSKEGAREREAWEARQSHSQQRRSNGAASAAEASMLGTRMDDGRRTPPRIDRA